MRVFEKMKKSWENMAKSTSGFTLVELIVVIAILAILAGVAVPAYSGYVEKAERAEDEQLLATVNTAFAAACIDEGMDYKNLPTLPSLNLNTDNTVKEVAMYDAVFATFGEYYVGNESAAFSTNYEFRFDQMEGVFKFWEDDTLLYVKYGDDYVPISAEDVKKLAESTFINADGLGVEGLMTKVDFVASVAAGINDGSMYNSIIGDKEYKRAFLKNLGVEDVDSLNNLMLSKTFDEKATEMSKAMLNKMAQENGWTEEEKAAHQGEADAKVKANMAVLYAAQNTSNLTDTQISNLLNTNDPKGMVLQGATGGDKLAQAAMYYGMYVSYAHYKGDQELIDATEDPFEFFKSTDLDTEGFKEYINNTEQGKADLEAYKASMNIVMDSTTNEGAVNNVIVNGFTDGELLALIGQVVGK